MSWTIKPSEFTEVVETDIAQLRTHVSLDLMRGIILKTPVDTGRARGSWNVTYSSPAPLDSVRSAGEAISSNTQNIALKAQSPYEVVVISNSLPYIRKLENGSSKQAPAGMVSVSVESIKAKYKR